MPDTNQNTQQQPPLSPTNKKINLINEAREILRGERTVTAKQLENKYKELEHYNQFAYATELLLVKMKLDEEEGNTLKLADYQKLALYIYKDHSLPSMFKFRKAIQELKTHDDLAKTKSCESLGLAGAIYKRIWQFDHQFKNLILSQYYYRKGYLSWQEYLLNKNVGDMQKDDGYTAINYAYINELMGVEKLEEHGEITGAGKNINERLTESEEVRKFILEQFVDNVFSDNPTLKQNDFPNWVLATIAEGYFGLRKYNQSLLFTQQYLNAVANKPWEIKTFSQQLFSIAYLQQALKKFYDTCLPPAIDNSNKNLERITGEINAEGIRKCLLAIAAIKTKSDNNLTATAAVIPEIKKGGKSGLALSGGGFRASLFHIGVLAALAEKDELKNVEVLSCVSGGSIIGAYYYIKLKKLLETKTDSEITKDDYIQIIQETEEGFLKGVQKNLRVRIFSNLFCNLKMLFNKKYSRTHRLGQLYEKHLYKKIWDGENIYMSDLFIKPKGGDESFDISTDNWQRQNKIPQLVLNATSVNTGHNWQFTASWMGEPPGNIQADIDVKPRLRRMYYEEAPNEYKKFRIGYAVGASSCVPVMFHPMPMFDLYPGIELQLVDGGLHDNQGIAALIEQECSNMIISDASGQLPTKKTSAANEAAIFYRADSILQERLRELQFMDIKERNYTAQLNQLLKMHLKSDLQQRPVKWKDCIDPERTIVYEDLYDENKELTEYGVLLDVQTCLSNIRTDLDSFSDAEAYALMYSGYLQTHHEWNEKNASEQTGRDESLWQFSAVRDYVKIPAKSSQIRKVLEVGSKVFLKLPYLSTTVRIASMLLLLLLAILLGWLIYTYWDCPIIYYTVKSVFFLVLFFILGKIINGIGFLLSLSSEIRKWLVLLGLTIFGFIVTNFYLLILNPIYNIAGKLPKQKISHD